MILDMSVREQTYIEDCEVCCRPIEVHYTTHASRVETFDAQPA